MAIVWTAPRPGEEESVGHVRVTIIVANRADQVLVERGLMDAGEARGYARRRDDRYGGDAARPTDRHHRAAGPGSETRDRRAHGGWPAHDPSVPRRRDDGDGTERHVRLRRSTARVVVPAGRYTDGDIGA